MLWFVTPAHGRLEVTRLALEQRSLLIGDLAASPSGIAAACVVIACDENIDTAVDLGFEALELPNDHLADRVNAGIRFACVEGDATHVAYVGSDNWLHPAVFAGGLPEGPEILTGLGSFVVDLPRGLGRRLRFPPPYGVPPWVVPARLVERTGYEPILRAEHRRIDGQLARGLEGRYPRGPEGRERLSWRPRDPHDVARVGWKSGDDMTPYERVSRALGVGPVEIPWDLLARHYPQWLVEQARELSRSCAPPVLA